MQKILHHILQYEKHNFIAYLLINKNVKELFHSLKNFKKKLRKYNPSLSVSLSEFYPICINTHPQSQQNLIETKPTILRPIQVYLTLI